MPKIICPRCKKEIDKIIVVYSVGGYESYSHPYDEEEDEYVETWDLHDSGNTDSQFEWVACPNCDHYLERELFEEYFTKAKSKKEQMKMIIINEMTK